MAPACDLKNITQLFVARWAQSGQLQVIGRGPIDELILQRPDERRVVFETSPTSAAISCG